MSHKKIDITMTAVLRPDVINDTLKSFTGNLFCRNDFSYRLIINIDNIGENIKPKEIGKICRNYFDDVLINFSIVPSFTKAVMWLWENVDAEYVFHLEDDWILFNKIDLNNMVDILDNDPKLSCLHFSRLKINGGDRSMIFGNRYVYDYDRKIYVAKEPFGFSLNPVLIKGDFVKSIRENMVDNKNPEKQIRVRNKKMTGILYHWHYGVYSDPNGKPLVYGKNGLYWRKKQGLEKPRGKQFINWVREN